jgi:hypothetical protein
MEGRGDGEIMTYMEDTAREGDILGTVFSFTSKYLGSEVLKLDRLIHTTWFVEAIHYKVVMGVIGEVGRTKIELALMDYIGL